jgi:hypothetical protein
MGGLVMPIPAVLWSLYYGHGIWYPVNLLAGMVLPGIGSLEPEDLEKLRPTLLLVGVVIHIVMSVVMGMIYGVLMPTLPPIPKPLAWGGLLVPLLWTAVTFSLMTVVNPVLARGVNWPWFIASQFVFGVGVALVTLCFPRLPPVTAGLVGGIFGGLLMPIPAVLWSLANGHGLWYPGNLLAAMVIPGMEESALTHFNAGWLTAAIILHACMSLAFGVVFGLIMPRVGPIPGPLAWGGLLMPLLWMGTSYGLMGVVNPLLQKQVNWPWFVVSQFVFGLTAALVVVRSEKVPIPPAGTGPAAGPQPL